MARTGRALYTGLLTKEPGGGVTRAEAAGGQSVCIPRLLVEWRCGGSERHVAPVWCSAVGPCAGPASPVQKERDLNRRSWFDWLRAVMVGS